MATITLPWSFKLIYGMISDNIRICGGRRRPYLCIFSLLFFVMLMLVFLLQPNDPVVVTFLLMMAAWSLAFIMVVSEAIMVQESRKDPRFGSQDFVSLNYMSKGVGGSLGCIFGGFMTQHYHPKWCFFWHAWMGVILFVFAFKTKDYEEEQNVTGSQLVQENDYSITTV